MSESAPTRHPVFEGWEMRQWTPTERPKHIDPATWEKVSQLRDRPLLPYTATAEYLGRIQERLKPYEFPKDSDLSRSQGNPERQKTVVNTMLKYFIERYKYLDSHIMMPGAVTSKEAFVQDISHNYMALRMLYPSGAGALASNLFGELLAHGAGYHLDLFKANFAKLTPPIEALSLHARLFEATSDYVTRVANEIRPLSTPLRAVAFRHAIKTGDRSHYWDGDLVNAYYAADRAREQADRRFKSPVAANREVARVVRSIQHSLDSGRPFNPAQAHELLGPVLSR
jgi:hypothetical protein